MGTVNPSDDIMAEREKYAKMALLLFHPFRSRDDLLLNGSFWNKYIMSINDANGQFWPKGLEILQNIQDINYNCSQLDRPIDPVTAATVLTEHEKNKELDNSSEEENPVGIDQVETMLESLTSGNGDSSSIGISEPDIDKRRLNYVANRVDVPSHTINSIMSPTTMKDITDIPEEVTRQVASTVTTPANNTDPDSILQQRNNYLQNHEMVVEMITGKVFQPLDEVDWGNENPYASNSLACKINMEAIIKANTLDLKQAAAFEILACSFILSCLDDYKITESELNKLFTSTGLTDKVQRLQSLKAMLNQKGSKRELVMFLSGMGGSGKSTVIKAFYKFANHLCDYLGWTWHDNTIKLTAMTGSAASLLDKANTLHMTACLNKTKISDEEQDKWVGTKMLFIDEISFMTSGNLTKLDKNLRFLTQTPTVLFGGVSIILVGDFHQMNPVKGTPLYKVNGIQFTAINQVVFLNRSHRFKDNPVFGQLLRRFRNGDITENDMIIINSRFIENPDVTLPEHSDLRYACSSNEERNAISTSIFLKHLQATHTESDDPSTDCPNHTVIIKGTLKYGGKTSEYIGRNLRNMIYETCGDADVENNKGM